MKRMTSSSTLRNVPFLRTVPMDNPSSARAETYLINRYFMGGYKKRLWVMSYLGYSRNVRLNPSLRPDLEIPTAPPTTRIN